VGRFRHKYHGHAIEPTIRGVSAAAITSLLFPEHNSQLLSRNQFNLEVSANISSRLKAVNVARVERRLAHVSESQ
jgi:hypothetical protein